MDSFANGRLSGLAWLGTLARSVKESGSRRTGSNFSQFLPALSSQSPGPDIALWLQCVAGRTEARDPIRSHEALQDSGKSLIALCDGHLR